MKPLPKPGEVSPDAPRVIETVEISDREQFLVRDDGLWHVKEGKKDSADTYTRLTLEPFRVTRRLVPIEGEDQRGLLVRIGEREVAVPRARIASETDIAKWLADHGVLFDSRQTGLIRLYFSIANANVLLAYTRNGWQVDGAFVAGDQIIGSRGGGRVMHTDSVVSKFERAGTYEQWREEVLPFANRKPGWIFGILAGLSSPLLHRTNISTGCIFNLYGRSSIGKTVALQAAANVWGMRPTSNTHCRIPGCLSRRFGLTVRFTSIIRSTVRKNSIPNRSPSWTTRSRSKWSWSHWLAQTRRAV